LIFAKYNLQKKAFSSDYLVSGKQRKEAVKCEKVGCCFLVE
jgi:hypothetical protein